MNNNQTGDSWWTICSSPSWQWGDPYRPYNPPDWTGPYTPPQEPPEKLDFEKMLREIIREEVEKALKELKSALHLYYGL
jgi:hypothetical protein